MSVVGYAPSNFSSNGSTPVVKQEFRRSEISLQRPPLLGCSAFSRQALRLSWGGGLTSM